ncbi:MAG: biopolymer transporter ExbD [Porticoccaceae bacterium]|nr:biopolymer transporter ExbD [Porticoccaceae bacterium]
MKFHRQPRTENGINLTPLIDVVFLLLIFFMVSTTFTRETRLVVELPEAEGQMTEAAPETLEIVVAKDNSYSVNGRLLVNREIDTLMDALEEVSAGKRDIPLVISADSDTSHRAVVTAMDAAGRLGFTQLRIATQEPAEEPQ